MVHMAHHRQGSSGYDAVGPPTAGMSISWDYVSRLKYMADVEGKAGGGVKYCTSTHIAGRGQKRCMEVMQMVYSGCALPVL